jgi:ubiquinone/menaquinone biosynthesis C-methylase UbiE
MQIDWSLGQYETTAAQLLPAARAVVDRAALAPGERVVDVGCGTGTTRRSSRPRTGAHVTGVDPAGRLLEVAREQATERGLDARFVQGEAAALPLEDASAEVLLSVFGVIFAPDAAAAAAEMARVAAPGGRIVLSAWIPGGAMLDWVTIPAP